MLDPLVYVNHGRWVVECPSGDNNAFEILGSNRWFTCTLCKRDFQVRLPYNHDLIDKILGQRPNLMNRNWLPTETTAALIQENTENL